MLRRDEAEGVQNGSVKRVTQMGSPVIEWALSSGGGLNGKAQEGNHGKTSMLDLCELKPGFLLRVGCKTQRVEVFSTRVDPLLRVKLCVPLEFNVSNNQNFNPNQCGKGEWEWLP